MEQFVKLSSHPQSKFVFWGVLCFMTVGRMINPSATLARLNMTSHDATHTLGIGRKYLTHTCSFLDSPYPLEEEETLPIPSIPGILHQTQPHLDSFTTPLQPTIPNRWDRALDEIAAKMPTVGKLCSFARLQSFVKHKVLERTHATVGEFSVLNPSAGRDEYPRDVKDMWLSGLKYGLFPQKVSRDFRVFPLGFHWKFNPAHFCHPFLRKKTQKKVFKK